MANLHDSIRSCAAPVSLRRAGREVERMRSGSGPTGFWERAFPQTPTVLGVRGDRYKLIRFHGVWEPYELYDLETDPHEMRNLLGDVRVETQAGTLDRQIVRRASPDVRELFTGLMERLNAIVRETGALDQPTWRAAAAIR